ncbi:hypothetical protein [Psychrobacillus sp. NPDC093180]|uniref:hypothetical protein n=1 Tax=Psychrobacillus sp. NPDC093180 TaxID=3364489 RepID=UPI0037FA0982
MLKFIQEIINAEGLKVGLDYEIVSYLTMDDDLEFFSIDEWYKIDSLNYFQIARIKENHFQEMKKLLRDLEPYPLDISPTPDVENPTFYLLKDKINVSVAILFGLGVVQILRGQYKGQFMLYNSTKMNESDLITEDTFDEMLKLKLYFQYISPIGYHDQGIEYLLNNNWNNAKFLFYSRPDEVRKKFKEIFDTTKQRKEVIEVINASNTPEWINSEQMYQLLTYISGSSTKLKAIKELKKIEGCYQQDTTKKNSPYFAPSDKVFTNLWDNEKNKRFLKARHITNMRQLLEHQERYLQKWSQIGMHDNLSGLDADGYKYNEEEW